MTEAEAKQIKPGDHLYVADLLVRVDGIYQSRGVTFFQTEYGDFTASICERGANES